MESIRTLFFSRHFLQKALPTLADPLPTGAVTQSMNREAIQQVWPLPLPKRTEHLGQASHIL
jgi:hypothetical protein